MQKRQKEIVVRPHELVEIISRLGAGRDPSDLGKARLTGILKTIMSNPRIRLRFNHYRGGKYNGKDTGAPHGVAQTMLWDMEIVHSLAGKKERERDNVMEPVTTGFDTLRGMAGNIASIEGICTFANPAAPAWSGMPGVTAADYERGCARLKKMFEQILPSHICYRTDAEIAEIRARHARQIEDSDCIRLFPQHILFVIAHYGRCADMLEGRVFDGDSMYEVGVMMRRYPDKPVMLIPEHCMLCPTCRGYDPEGFGTCGVVPDDLKPVENSMANRVNLNLLRTLGLEFYQKIPAVSLVTLAFERLGLAHLSFTYKGSPPAVWAYARGRYAGMGFLDAYQNAPGVISRVHQLLENSDVNAILPDADKQYIAATLKKAEEVVNDRERYLALIDDHFAYLWKFYLEKIAQSAARLPAEIKSAREEREGQPVIAAERLGPEADSLETVAARWKDGLYSSGFLTSGDRPAIAGTAIGAALGKDRIYISVLCAERNIHGIKADLRVGPELFEHQRWSKNFGLLDDSVAIMLSPESDPGVCYQFSFNAKGVKAAKIMKLAKDRKDGDEWIRETDWRVVINVENGLWRGTVEIPLNCLPKENLSAGNWRMNVVRFFRDESLSPHAWSKIKRDYWALDMHLYETGRFGRLILTPDASLATGG